MQRKNRLAVFEHVPHKERTSPTKNTRYSKRSRSPDPSFEDNVTQRPVKRRRQGVPLKNEKLLLNCEYNECNFSTDNYYHLIKHVDEHVDDEEETTAYKCLWRFCEYLTENNHSLKQHLTYHVYHSKLKNIGSNALSRLKLPDCKEICEFKVPKQPHYYCCEWDGCDTIMRDYQSFIDHVKCHVNGAHKVSINKTDVIKCDWTGCTNLFPAQYKLGEHVKCHTKEKVVACPVCGVMFSCITKFYDHRKRQLATELQGYQCSQCTKLFASERLLRDHMRIHINHYKCHLCDMTCTKPSSLAKHIRYRHLCDRIFKCDICSHMTITKQDLLSHKTCHDQENRFQCLQCTYSCRSKYAYKTHLQKVHEDSWEYKYACHCCDKRFGRGAELSKHLMKVHGFHWPSGHSRFLYKQNRKTGLLNLQVVRYESVEVTQEMIQGNKSFHLENPLNSKYECKQVDGKPFSYVLSYIGNGNEDITIDELNGSDNCDKNKQTEDNNSDVNGGKEVLISIGEIDLKGNVVKIEKTEACKILSPDEVNSSDYKLIK